MADPIRYSAPDGRTLAFEAEPSPEQLDEAFQHDLLSRVDEQADTFGVPREIAHGLVATESGYRHTDNDGNPLRPRPTPDNPHPTASGLTQMTEAALKDVGEDGKSVDSNLRAGMKYLKAHYKGDWAKALAAYKQGAASLAKDGIKPETRDYQNAVLLHEHPTAQLTGGPVVLGSDPQSRARRQDLIKSQFLDSPGKIVARGAYKTIAPGVGAAALSEFGPAGIGAGAAGGYATADAVLTALGLQDPAQYSPKESFKTAATIGVSSAAGPYGPAAFGAAGGLVEAVKLELARRQGEGGGASEKLDPSEYGGLAGMMGMDKVPYGKVLARASTDALMDILARFGMSRLASPSHMTDEVRDAQAGIERSTADATLEQGKREALDAKRAVSAEGKAQRETQAEFAPEVARTKQSELLGMTPEQSAAQFVTDPAEGGVASETAATQRQVLANAVHKPMQRIQDQLGQAYEDLLGKDAHNVANVASLHQDIAAHIGELKEKGLWRSLSPDTRAMYGKALRLARAKDQALALETEATAAEGAVPEPPPLGALKPGLFPREAEAARLQAAKSAEAARNAATKADAPASIQDLLNLRSQASKSVAFARSAADREQAMLLQDYTLKALENSGIKTPELRALNMRYKYDRDAFRGIAGKVAKNVDPGDWGARVFTDRVAAHKIWDAATMEERADLRSALGTYVFSRKNPRIALDEMAKSGVLEKYFGQSALSKARVWIEAAPKAVKFDTLLAESPQAKQAYEAKLKGYLGEIADRAATRDVDQVRKLAGQLGPAGSEVEAKLNHAILTDPTGKQAHQIAHDFLNQINPHKGGQLTPTKLLASALSRVSKTARSNAISTHMQAMTIRGALEQMEHGHVAPHVAAYGWLYALKVPGQLLKGGLYMALRNPRIAEAYIRGLNTGDLDAVARASADAIAAQATSTINDDTHMRTQQENPTQ